MVRTVHLCFGHKDATVISALIERIKFWTWSGFLKDGESQLRLYPEIVSTRRPLLNGMVSNGISVVSDAEALWVMLRLKSK